MQNIGYVAVYNRLDCCQARHSPLRSHAPPAKKRAHSSTPCAPCPPVAVHRSRRTASVNTKSGWPTPRVRRPAGSCALRATRAAPRSSCASAPRPGGTWSCCSQAPAVRSTSKSCTRTLQHLLHHRPRRHLRRRRLRRRPRRHRPARRGLPARPSRSGAWRLASSGTTTARLCPMGGTRTRHPRTRAHSCASFGPRACTSRAGTTRATVCSPAPAPQPPEPASPRPTGA